MTVQEYEEASKAKRLSYRLYRNPSFYSAWVHCSPSCYATAAGPENEAQRTCERRHHQSTHRHPRPDRRLDPWLRTCLLIQLPVLWLAGALGIWLFYVQHQFEGGYWARKEEWDALRAAMEGSSYYELPTVLRWFSANIGYHHVHHLNARIPNYRLKACFDAIPELRKTRALTIRRSLSSVRLKLWDEERRTLVRFSVRSRATSDRTNIQRASPILAKIEIPPETVTPRYLSPPNREAPERALLTWSKCFRVLEPKTR